VEDSSSVGRTVRCFHSDSSESDPSYRCNCLRFAKLTEDLFDHWDQEDSQAKVDSRASVDQENLEVLG